MLQRLFETLSGAQRGEQRPVLLSFLALYFLLLSYYLVKPLREARLFMHFSADMLPYFFLAMPVIALLVTKFFNFWVGRVPRYRLMLYTYLLIVLCKLAFLISLPLTGRIATVLFFFWASVYFTLALSILWAVINTIFRSDQAERFFGFVALGATLGNISGARLSSWLAGFEPLKDWALLFAALAMGVALGLIWLAVYFCEHSAENNKQKSARKAHVSRGWEDLREILRNRYVRGIAVMVFGLALMGTAINLQALRQIDLSLAQKTYQEVFSNDSNNVHFETIYGLKKLSTEAQQIQLTALFKQAQFTAAEQATFESQYAQYKEKLESKTRKLFADIYFWQGVLGIVLLTVVARLLFRHVGLRWSVLILPGFFFVVGVALLFPVELMLVQLMLIVGGALNYSLNNATKELLYTPTDESVRFQLKPLIEGPVMRIGDVSASVFKILISSALAVWIGLSEGLQGQLLLLFGLIVVLFWAWSIWQTGLSYDQSQQKRRRKARADA